MLIEFKEMKIVEGLKLCKRLKKYHYLNFAFEVLEFIK